MASTGKDYNSPVQIEQPQTLRDNKNINKSHCRNYSTLSSSGTSIKREYIISTPDMSKIISELDEYLEEDLNFDTEGYHTEDPQLTVEWEDHEKYEDIKGDISIEVDRTYLPGENSMFSELYRHISESYPSIGQFLTSNEQQKVKIRNQSWSSWKSILDTLEK